MPTVKTPEERGAVATWAYDARRALDLSPEAVVHRLGAYNAATIRKAESDSKNMSRPLWRALVKLYGEVAQEKGTAVRPAPMVGMDPTPAASGDIASLVAAISDLVTEMRLARERDQDAAAAMVRAAETLLRVQRPAEAGASTEPDVPVGSVR